MIFGTGIDIVEVCRMEDAAKKWGSNFLNKVFTPTEIKYSNARRFSCQHLAARFAAKEAIVKAFGAPKNFPVNWTSIEVLNDENGKPTIKFYGNALKLKKSRHISEVIVSMSHSKKYAVANAILLKKG